MALIELHSLNIVHCDLKPENIMFFGKQHRWKLLDLESAADIDSPSEVCPTLRYAAPEIIAINQKDRRRICPTQSADMWAFGIILFEVMSGTDTA